MTGTIFVILTFMGSTPGAGVQYHNASDEARRALLEYPSVKQELSKLDFKTMKLLNEQIGLTREELFYVGYAYPLVLNKLTTKPFKSLRIEFYKDWYVRPEIEYTWIGDPKDRFSGLMVIDQEF